jgi:hypothetical protein
VHCQGAALGICDPGARLPPRRRGHVVYLGGHRRGSWALLVATPSPSSRCKTARGRIRVNGVRLGARAEVACRAGPRPARYTPALRSSRVSHHDMWMVGERAVEGALRAILEMKRRRSPVSIRYWNCSFLSYFPSFRSSAQLSNFWIMRHLRMTNCSYSTKMHFEHLGRSATCLTFGPLTRAIKANRKIHFCHM